MWAGAAPVSSLQSENSGPFVWVDLLGGFVSPGPSLGGKLNVDAFHGWTVSGEYLKSEEFCIFCHGDPERVEEINVLLGRRIVRQYSYAYFNLGMGLVSGNKRGKMIDDGSGFLSFGPTYETLRFHTIGIPIEAGVSWAWFHAFGLGVNFHLNLNSENPAAGVLLNVPFGHVN